jgi:hypothetical protein
MTTFWTFVRLLTLLYDTFANVLRAGFTENGIGLEFWSGDDLPTGERWMSVSGRGAGELPHTHFVKPDILQSSQRLSIMVERNHSSWQSCNEGIAYLDFSCIKAIFNLNHIKSLNPSLLDINEL